MRWTKKSLSLRFAKRKFILFLVLMETGQGRTLLLSAFSTTDTCGAKGHQLLVFLAETPSALRRVYLSEGDDQLTHVFLATVEADVVVGDEQLSNYVHLCKGHPQSAVCVSIQTLVLRQPEHGAIPLVLRPCVQISGREQKENSYLDETKSD